MSWIQGGTATGANPSVSLTVGSGHALIVSIGVNTTGLGGILKQLTISDNFDNTYELVCVSPVQWNDIDDDFVVTQLVTFSALNCASGSTEIQVTGATGTTAMTVDEYSEVASIRAVDGITFNATLATSSPAESSVNSGLITVNGTELIYSAAFANSQYETFTPSAGFTQRQLQNNSSSVSLVSYDKSVTGGSTSNTVSVNSAPDALHVVLFALSSTPVVSPILQKGYGAASGIIGTNVTVVMPRNTTQGNLLIACARVYERGDFTINDTQNNEWVTFNYPAEQPNLVMGYCLSNAGGALTVTLQSNSGGDDVAFLAIVAEYNYQTATFLNQNNGVINPGQSVSTGNIATSGQTVLLISAMSGQTNTSRGLNPEPPIENLETWRWQLSDQGTFNEYPGMIVLADQTVALANVYSNTFTTLATSNELNAGIFGFVIPAGNCFLVDFPITGAFKNLDGSPLSYGTLSIRLVFDCNCPCADYQITGNNHVMIPLDVNGVVMGTTKLRPNNQLQPSGSYYILQAYSESGQLVFGPKILVV